MKANYTYSIGIASIFIWLGFVGAISFMEAWLKFQAPGIDLALGLGIGRLVFSALNKVELFLCLIIASNLLYGGVKNFGFKMVYVLIPILIVVVQSLWMLPALDARAELHIQRLEVPASNLHFYYVATEVIKVIGLVLFGIRLLKLKKQVL